MLIQTPVPLPPGLDQAFLVERVQEAVMMTLVLIAAVVVSIKVLAPIARAWARKLEGKAGDPQLHAELEQMREQLGEVDALRTRVGELEDRLDFAERILAQRRDHELLKGGGPG